jgi:hypothetical protein
MIPQLSAIPKANHFKDAYTSQGRAFVIKAIHSSFVHSEICTEFTL